MLRALMLNSSTWTNALVSLVAGVTLLHAAKAGSQAIAAMPIVKPVMACSALQDSSMTLADGASAKIATAETIDREPAPFCKLRGTISGTIGFEARLPLNNWSQRYLQLGCGGLCGSIQLSVRNASGCLPAETGALALASTDMGHQGAMDGKFGNDAQARIDFAYRGVHLTALTIKQIIGKFYGQPARYSYFSGCSDGGREALMEAQRFPADFDGIAAGAPVLNFQVQNTFYHAWQARSNTGANGHAILAADRLPLLHQGALAACDEIDGLEDGQITDPRQCTFDPATLQCPKGNDATARCLTAAEAAAAQALYRGAHTAKGERLVIGGPQPGSELSWAGVFVPKRDNEPIFSSIAALAVLQYIAFETNPRSFSIGDLKFDRQTFERLRPMHALYDATKPNLRAFSERAGKLILWHGWSDPHIAPVNTIAYFEAMQKEMGEASTDRFARLFLFPGMYHCNGGDGPSQFDVLTPLMSWVERGIAPAQIVAARPIAMQPTTDRLRSRDEQVPAAARNLAVDRTRPIYPYPAIAVYRGSGSIDDASSFVAQRGATGPSAYEWVGRDFMTPGFHRDCVARNDKVVCTSKNEGDGR